MRCLSKNKKNTSQKVFTLFGSKLSFVHVILLFFHSFFEFTVFLSVVGVSLVGRIAPLLSNELTDCSSPGEWGALACDAASANCCPMIFVLACLKWSLSFSWTTLMHMDVSARPKMR